MKVSDGGNVHMGYIYLTKVGCGKFIGMTEIWDVKKADTVHLTLLLNFLQELFASYNN